MQNAFKCNECGFISYSPGTHHGQKMVAVIVEDNIRIGVAGPPVATIPAGTSDTPEHARQTATEEDDPPVDNQPQQK